MKIAFFSELSNVFDSQFGGAETQIKKTAEYLRKLGVDVFFSDNVEDALKADIIHLFRLSDEAVDFFYSLPYKRPLVAVSPVFWYENIPISLTDYSLRDFIIKKWKLFSRKAKGNKLGLKNFYKIRSLLKRTDILLPNSYMEAQHIRDFFNIHTAFEVVPNAIDVEEFHELKDPKIIEGMPEEFLLSVGRIDEIKNRFNIIKAAQILDIAIVLIGNPNTDKYFDYLKKKIKKIGFDKVIFINNMDHKELIYYYKNAKVHILASWFETTGLVSLEAAYCGCPIVVSNRGATREYFGKHAFYCDPDNPKSIAEAVKKAMKSEPDGQLKNKIARKYSWKTCAEKTLEAYEAVLKK